jgi:hypothetical protein
VLAIAIPSGIDTEFDAHPKTLMDSVQGISNPVTTIGWSNSPFTSPYANVSIVAFLFARERWTESGWNVMIQGQVRGRGILSQIWTPIKSGRRVKSPAVASSSPPVANVQVEFGNTSDRDGAAKKEMLIDYSALNTSEGVQPQLEHATQGGQTVPEPSLCRCCHRRTDCKPSPREYTLPPKFQRYPVVHLSGPRVSRCLSRDLCRLHPRSALALRRMSGSGTPYERTSVEKRPTTHCLELL